MSNWSLLVITCEAAAGILLPVLGSPLQKRCWYWNESIRQTKTISWPKHMEIIKHWKKLACSALRWQDLEGLRRWGVKLQQEISMLSSTTSWECKGKQRAKPFLKGYRIRCNKDKAETLIKVFLHWLDKSFSSLVVVGCCICLFGFFGGVVCQKEPNIGISCQENLWFCHTLIRSQLDWRIPWAISHRLAPLWAGMVPDNLPHLPSSKNFCISIIFWF